MTHYQGSKFKDIISQAYDEESDILRTDYGLGETQHDVFVRSYSRHDQYFDGYEMITVDDVDLPEGVTMWVRIRPVNNGKALFLATLVRKQF